MKMTTTVSVARALSSRYGITVKMQGNVAKTNGKSITIPDLGSSLDEEKLLLLRGYLDHEAGGHGRHTDFDALLGLEKPEVASLSNAFEDIRVEALLSAEFAGCRNNLAALNDRLFGGPEAAQSPVLLVAISRLPTPSQVSPRQRAIALPIPSAQVMAAPAAP